MCRANPEATHEENSMLMDSHMGGQVEAHELSRQLSSSLAALEEESLQAQAGSLPPDNMGMESPTETSDNIPPAAKAGKVSEEREDNETEARARQDKVCRELKDVEREITRQNAAAEPTVTLLPTSPADEEEVTRPPVNLFEELKSDSEIDVEKELMLQHEGADEAEQASDSIAKDIASRWAENRNCSRVMQIKAANSARRKRVQRLHSDAEKDIQASKDADNRPSTSCRRKNTPIEQIKKLVFRSLPPTSDLASEDIRVLADGTTVIPEEEALERAVTTVAELNEKRRLPRRANTQTSTTRPIEQPGADEILHLFPKDIYGIPKVLREVDNWICTVIVKNLNEILSEDEFIGWYLEPYGKLMFESLEKLESHRVNTCSRPTRRATLRRTSRRRARSPGVGMVQQALAALLVALGVQGSMAQKVVVSEQVASLACAEGFCTLTFGMTDFVSFAIAMLLIIAVCIYFLRKTPEPKAPQPPVIVQSIPPLMMKCHVQSQSMVTYKRKWAKPEFQVLPEGAHG